MFFISPPLLVYPHFTRLLQTKPRMGEQPVFEEGNNFVCRNVQTHALSVQVGFYFVYITQVHRYTQVQVTVTFEILIPITK